MRHKLTILFLLLALRGLAATGDIIGIEIETNGWIARVTVEGMGTNGMFYNGFGTNNTLTSSNMLRIDLVSMGFNASGTATTVGRSVYGTKLLRRTYPSQTTNDISAQGSDVVFKVALSDIVYSKDSNLTATARAGYYVTTNNGTSANAFSGVTVTNSSTMNYPKVIGNFATEQRRTVNGTETIEVFAVHKYGTRGKPLARVNITATGATSGNTVSGSATEMVLSPRGDKIPVYAVNLNLSTSVGFTRGEVVDVNFMAFPWIGDSNAVLNATNHGGAIYELGALKRTIMDRMIAVVDPVSGNDTTGTVSTNQATADAAPLATINGALTKIAATNNLLWSLNRLDGGEVQCKAGNYNVGRYGAQPVTAGYFTITSHSSTDADGVVFTNFVTSQSQYAYQRYYNVTFRRNGNGFLVFGANPNVLIMERVKFMDGFTGWYSGDTGTDIEFLDCITTNSVFSKGGNDGRSRLIRNVTYTNLAGSSLIVGNANCVLGVKGLGSAQDFWNPLFGSTPRNVIVAFTQWHAKTDGYFMFSSAAMTNVAIVQNLFERIGSSATPLWEISDNNLDHFLFWNNTFAGQRVNHENDISSPYVNKFLLDWTGKGNIFNARGDHRADIFDSTSNMTGSWSVGYSVGWSGNWNEASAYRGDTDFWGLFSNQSTGPSFANTNLAGYMADRSQAGSNTGNGNYRLQSSGLAVLCRDDDWRLPFDLHGQPRGLSDPPGAFIDGNPRKGGFF